MIKASALAVTLALTLGYSQAATLVNNGAPDLVYGTAMTEGLVADNFSLASVGGTNNIYTITNIRFWSEQNSAAAYTGTVNWAIYSDASSQPGVALTGGLAAVAGTSTGATTAFGYNIWSYDIPVAAFSLSAGSYWLVLLNGATPTVSPPNDMLWASSGSGTGNGVYFSGGAWINSTNEHAFRIDGIVPSPIDPMPEPGSIALVLAGLLAAGGLRQKRRI